MDKAPPSDPSYAIRHSSDYISPIWHVAYRSNRLETADLAVISVTFTKSAICPTISEIWKMDLSYRTPFIHHESIEYGEESDCIPFPAY